jgi:hypothetical protein
MNKQLLNAIGKALYEATADPRHKDFVSWEILIFKDVWIRRAEAVANAYLQFYSPKDEERAR